MCKCNYYTGFCWNHYHLGHNRECWGGLLQYVHWSVASAGFRPAHVERRVCARAVSRAVLACSGGSPGHAHNRAFSQLPKSVVGVRVAPGAAHPEGYVCEREELAFIRRREMIAAGQCMSLYVLLVSCP